jgi:hypothetical protein
MKRTHTSSLIGEILSQNQLLLSRLIHLQRERYTTTTGKEEVGKEELEMAWILQENLVVLAQLTQPKDLSGGMDVEHAMRLALVEGREAMYRGVISNGRKAVISNVVGQAAFS